MSHKRKSVPIEELIVPEGSGWRKVPAIAAVLGLAGIGASAALGWGTKQFYFSYLVAFSYFLSLAVGGLFFVIVQFAARAGWSVVVRRIAENMMSALPLFLPLFVPIALGLHDLYHWSHPEALTEPILLGKASYLNPRGFFLRAAIYFAIWIALTLYFYRKSTAQDVSGDQQLTRKMQMLSGPAIVLFAFTVTFASFDWIMSLDPHWYSTIFGAYFFSGSIVSMFAFIALMGLLLRRSGLLKNVITVEHYHDLGKLVFAFTVFWAYIAFSQFMLIWYANIPEETIWYEHRLGGWLGATIFLCVGHFLAPFFYMMSRGIKRVPGTLMLGTFWILVVHYVDLYWLIMPTLHHHAPHPALMDLTTFVGIGGLFVAVVARGFCKHALAPARDPRLPESLAFENI